MSVEPHSSKKLADHELSSDYLALLEQSTPINLTASNPGFRSRRTDDYLSCKMVEWDEYAHSGKAYETRYDCEIYVV